LFSPDDLDRQFLVITDDRALFVNRSGLATKRKRWRALLVSVCDAFLTRDSPWRIG
jgi:hypothetical protein